MAAAPPLDPAKGGLCTNKAPSASNRGAWLHEYSFTAANDAAAMQMTLMTEGGHPDDRRVLDEPQ